MTANRNLAVGAFITAALIIGTSLAVWITGQKGSEPTRSYSVMVEDNVSGLMLGGPVYFLGVKVGDVTKLSIEAGNPPLIRVDIRVLASAPVNQGTWATLAPQGITGVSVINLANDPGEHPALGASGDSPYPTIPYRDSGFSALMSSAPVVMEKIETLLENTNELLSQDNRTAVTVTLANLQSLSDSLREQQSALAALPASVTQSLAEVDRLTSRLSGLIDEGGPTLLASISNIEQTTGQLASTAARLDAWTTSHDEDMRAFVGDGLGQIPALIEQSNTAIRELEKLLEQLRQEPASLVRERQSESIEWEQ